MSGDATATGISAADDSTGAVAWSLADDDTSSGARARVPDACQVVQRHLAPSPSVRTEASRSPSVLLSVAVTALAVVVVVEAPS